MPQPTFIGSGTTCKKGDTRLMLHAKLLGAIQNGLSSPLVGNNPKRNDTLRRLKVKITRAHATVTENGA